MTPFQKVLTEIFEGKAETPKVFYGGKEIDGVGYHISVTHYYLKIFAIGLKVKNIHLKDYKTFYGLKGKSAKECLADFEKRFSHIKSLADAHYLITK